MNEQPKESPKTVRCAIYTRVSTTDNLEQAFTSLDVQRESGESYIASQKQEGWVILPDRYDDAGFTGANTDRPALQQLIEHIKAHQIDCVVVYKVDRLSRSLLDFTQLLEFLDKNNVAFISVTQHFNTQTSMGRLTLNILLSFAQFEREMISERTRDKMGAARRKGRFVGGRPALGYDLDTVNHKLVVNTKEAELIHRIFNLYLEKKSCVEVAKILNNEGYRTKSFLAKGRAIGNIPFKNTNVQWVIRNMLYVGKINYHGEIYQGIHEPIISEETFNKAQLILDENNRQPRVHKRAAIRGLLSRIFRCKNCNSSMLYTYTYKENYKYVYYVCTSACKRGYHTCPTKGITAHTVEDQVLECLKKIPSTKNFPPSDWDMMTLDQKHKALTTVLKEVNYDGTTKTLTIITSDGKSTEFKVNIKNPQIEKREDAVKKEPQLRQNLILAHQIQSLLDNGQAQDVKQVAGWLNLSSVRISQFMNMLSLSPTIQQEILFTENAKISAIPEYKINELSHELYWDKQLESWRKILPQISE